MTRRKPDARHPARPAAKGGSKGPRDPQRPNQGGGKPRPYGAQGKPTRESRPEGSSEGRSGRPVGKSGGKPAGKRPHAPRDDRKGDFAPRRPEGRDERRDDRKSDFTPRRSEGRAEARPERPARNAEYGQERDRPERHGGGRPHGGDKFAPRNREYRGDLPVWLYGSHAVLAALENEERLIRRILLTREAREALEDRLPRLSAQPETVDKAKLDSLLPPGAVHQGIAMLTDPLDDPGVEWLKEPLEEDSVHSNGREVVLLLDHVTDPRNVGAILRSAAAFGARAVIVTDRHAPEATGALAKAASGGLEVVPLIRVTNLSRALDLLAEYGFWRVGLEMETDKSLAEAVNDIKRVALVLGAEDEGLRRLTREKCDFLAKLPMTGAVESLNVSAAAAVALYECARG
ncbi:23S rRNA (guanosine(2251)-2'-O)-methyltransferase RlmB [Ferrovibrio terrae]|uniref:23S rRNA (guanosine(2251)-2'-O)-methyltransferase RlmB n=1 Tax=Ferrovibrio terrae TaxID=2594003 RepID=UPI003137C716